MAEMENIDTYAFEPYAGGYGVRVSCTNVASTPVGIPGINTFQKGARVMLTNSGGASAFMRIGSNDRADTNCMEVMPGEWLVVTVPFSSNGYTISGITEGTDTTKVSVIAGRAGT